MSLRHAARTLSRALPLAGVLLSTQAHALTEPDRGGWLSIAAGGDLDTRQPIGAGPSWEVSAGLWLGRHDDAYAFGKYTGVGATVHQAWLRGALVTEPTLEVRHGADIVVVSTQVFAAVGPHLESGAIGVVARAGGGLKYRTSATTGLIARAQAGAVYADQRVGVSASLSIGFEISSPWHRAH